MQNIKETSPKDPLLGFFGYLASVVISAVAVIYLGYHFVNGFAGELVTEYALQITEQDTVEFDAYILRNETIVYSDTVGGVGYNYSDGAKVRVGSAVADIYGGGSVGELRDDIIALDAKIGLLTESNSIDGLAASDTSTIDARIDSYYRTIRLAAEQGEYVNLPKRRDELLTLLNKRQVITGRVESFDSVIENLENERDILTEQMDTITETVLAPVTGFFSSAADGYENIFTADAAKKMTLTKFDEMLASEPSELPPTAIGKIATEFTWYVMLETTRDDLRYYNEGYTYQLIFPYNNDTMLEMKLYDIVAYEGENRVILVFSSGEIPENFSFRRMQSVELVRSSFTGYKVPISAVRLLNDRMGVYIQIGNTIDFRYIDVILETDGYYIVAPQDVENDPDYRTKLGLYDIMITGGKDLYVGKMIS